MFALAILLRHDLLDINPNRNPQDDLNNEECETPPESVALPLEAQRV